MARVDELEELASKLIGDGRSPNVYFVTNSSGNVAAIFTLKSEAIDYAEDTGRYLVEDRKNGEVWSSPEYDRRQQEDDED